VNDTIRRDKMGNAIGGPATGAQRAAQDRALVSAGWDAMGAADAMETMVCFVAACPAAVSVVTPRGTPLCEAHRIWENLT